MKLQITHETRGGGKLSVLLAVMLAATFAPGKTCTWTGAGDGVSYANASNWDNGVPEADDTAVFRPTGDLFVAFSEATAGMGEWRFESGNTVFGITQTKANLGFATSSILYVAVNATATISNRVAGAAAGTQLTISGGGLVEFYGALVDNVGYIDLVDITNETSVVAETSWRPLLTRIRSGSSLSFKGASTFPKSSYGHQSYASFQIDRGGTLDFNLSGQPKLGGICGEGTLRIGGANTFTFGLPSGSVTFGGITEYYPVNAVAGSLTVKFNPDDSSSTYTLASEDAFAGVTVEDSQYGTLRFLPSCAAYRLRLYRATSASGFVLENASGEPVALYGGWRSNTIDTVSTLPCRTGTVLGSVNGTVAVGSSSLWLDGTGVGGTPDISVSSGGTLVECTQYAPRNSATAENPAVIAFDGGTYRVSLAGTAENSVTQPFGSGDNATKVVLQVGAGGMRMGSCDGTCNREVAIHAAIQASSLPDGGFTRDVCHGKFVFRRPLAIAGPFTSLDGMVSVDPIAAVDVSASADWFGTGDAIFRNSILNVAPLASGTAINLASGSGSVFRYFNTATIRYSSDVSSAANKQSVTIGPAGAAKDSALVRGGKGSVLYLWDHIGYGSGLFDGTGSSLTVNGGLSTNASGTVKQPIVLYSSLENRIHFATCLDNGSLRAFTGYKTTLDGATSSDIVWLSSATAVPKNSHAYVGGLKLASSSATLTVNEGATLHVGNGVDPAIVIVDKPHISGASGTIDFGTSEGVFAGIHESTLIAPVLKGSGGVTFVAPPNLGSPFGWRYVRLGNNNLHSGGTYISSVRLSPETAGAFGVGDVHVGGGHEWGGRIHFNTAGLVFTNNFHVAGWGKRDVLSGDNVASGHGALTFTATTEISGDVELVEATRICCTNAGDMATFSGTVSGDALQLYNGKGTVLFTHANTYTGGTEIVASTLKISGAGTLGTGDVLLDGGTLVIDKDTEFALASRIRGKGTVKLEGKGAVDFAGGLEAYGYGGLVTNNFTLALGNRRRFVVSSLAGFSAVTTEAATPVKLYVVDGGEPSFDLPANVTFRAGPYIPPSIAISFR